MTDTTVTCETDERDEVAGQLHGRITFVASADDPESASSSHALDDIDEVRFHRGARNVERRGRVLELAFPDRQMSTNHGRWHRRGAMWLLEDTGSKNPPVIDGSPLRSTAVHDRAVVELGHSFFVLRQSFVEAVPTHFAADLDAAQPQQYPPALFTFAPSLACSFEKLVRVAKGQVPILLLGETGTGKEVVARTIHELSGRRGSLVAVNCGELAPGLVEGELFGHARGAFTNAGTARPGLIRSSDKGTLFLDEIGELPPDAQVRLLRVLQEHEVRPVGEERPVAVDLRLVSATLRDLEAAITGSRFRSDLYGRIAGHIVALPALRERREDIGLLLAAFRAKHRPVRFARLALRAIMRHDWPRNIRELELAVAEATALAPGSVVELEHLPAAVRRPAAAIAAPSLAAAQLSDEDLALRARLVELLTRYNGNVRVAAADLGKERSQIYRWIARLGIDLRTIRRRP